jgi:hypothetical protein
MVSRGVNPTLKHNVELGKYVVNSRAVAEAILRSRMLVAGEARNGSVRTEKNQAASG